MVALPGAKTHDYPDIRKDLCVCLHFHFHLTTKCQWRFLSVTIYTQTDINISYHSIQNTHIPVYTEDKNWSSGGGAGGAYGEVVYLILPF